MKDQLQYVRTALPAAAANANSASIDLGKPADGGFGNSARLVIRTPATPNLANGTTIIYTIQDSADNSSFAAVSTLGTRTITGPVSGGGLADVVEYPFPQTIRRYVRVNAAVLTGAGNNTAVSYDFAVEI